MGSAIQSKAERGRGRVRAWAGWRPLGVSFGVASVLFGTAFGAASPDSQAVAPPAPAQIDVRPVGSVSVGEYRAEEYCGVSTCTLYFSRESTRRMDEDLRKRKDSTVVLLTGVPGGVCATVGGAVGGLAGSAIAPGPGTAAGIGGGIAAGGAACATAAAHKVASLYDHLSDAAANKHCFAIRKPRWAKLGSTAALYGSEYLVRTTPGRCLD